MNVMDAVTEQDCVENTSIWNDLKLCSFQLKLDLYPCVARV